MDCFLRLLFKVFLFTICFQAHAERIAEPLSQIVHRYPDYSGSGATILKKIQKIKLDEQNLSKSISYVAIRIENEQAARDYGQIRIPFNSYLSDLQLDFANVMTDEGTITPLRQDAVQIQSTNNGNSYGDTRFLVFSLPNIQKGASFEFQFMVQETLPTVQKNWSGSRSLQWWQFRQNRQGYRLDPVKESELEVSTGPASKMYTFVPDFVNARFTQSAENGRIHYRWIASDLSEFAIETDMPMDAKYYPGILMSTMKDWGDINRWAHDLFQPYIKSDSTIAAIAKGISQRNLSEAEKIKAVFDFLQANIRYVFAHVGRGGYTPHKAEEVAKNGYGDCKDQTVLAIAILKELGIRAHPALLSSRGSSIREATIARNYFDHMITYIPAKQSRKAMWLDTSGDSVRFPGISWALQGQPALIIDGVQNSLVTLPVQPAETNLAKVDLSLGYTPENDIDIHVSMEFKGSFDEHLRGTWIYQQDRQRYFERLINQLYQNAEVIELISSDGNNLDEPFSLKATLRFGNTWKGEPHPLPVHTNLTQLLGLFTNFQQFEKPADRMSPITFEHGYRLELNTKLERPSNNYSLLTPVTGTSYSSPYFDVTQKGSRGKSGEYLINIVFESKPQIVMPANYEDFHGHMHKVLRDQGWVVTYQFDKKAAELAEINLNQKSDGLNNRIQKAEFYLDHGEFQNALKEARALVHLYPDSGNAHYILGMALGYESLFDESDRAFARAKELGHDI